MSGSSSTTRIRWVMPNPVLEGRDEYRGRAGGTGKPGCGPVGQALRGLVRGAGSGDSSSLTRAESLPLWCGGWDQHLIRPVQHLAALLLADLGSISRSCCSEASPIVRRQAVAVPSCVGTGHRVPLRRPPVESRGDDSPCNARRARRRPSRVKREPSRRIAEHRESNIVAFWCSG